MALQQLIKMKQLNLTFGLFFLSFLLLSMPANAGDLSALAFTKRAYPTMLAINKNSKDYAEKSMANFKQIFNFKEFNLRCSYDVKNKMSEAEYAKLEKIFSDVFFTNFKNESDKIYERRITKPKYHIKEESEKFTIVSATGQSKKGQATFSLYLKKNEKGEWQLIDLSIERVLLSRNYRGSFNRIYREHGFDGLYARLEKKKEKLTQR